MAKSDSQQCRQHSSSTTALSQSHKPPIPGPGSPQSEEYHGNTAHAAKQRSSGSVYYRAPVVASALFGEAEAYLVQSKPAAAAAAAAARKAEDSRPIVGPADIRFSPGIHSEPDITTTPPPPPPPLNPLAASLAEQVFPPAKASLGSTVTTPTPTTTNSSVTNSSSNNHELPHGEAAPQPSGGGGGASRWSKPASWFQFPPEIRNMIYDLSLVWPDSTTLYAGYNRQIDAYYVRQRQQRQQQQQQHQSKTPSSSSSSSSSDSGVEPFPAFKPQLWTPPLLLLCRAITAECLPVLRSRTLVIDRLPPWPPGATRPLAVSAFLGRRTLQAVSHIDLRVSLGAGRFGSGWVWGGVVLDLLSILLERNAFQSLRLLIRLSQLGDHNVWVEEEEVYRQMIDKVRELRQYNPKIFRPGEVQVEHWQVDRFVASKLREETAADETCEHVAMSLMRHPEDEKREYPDAEIWPGSILEFL